MLLRAIRRFIMPRPKDVVVIVGTTGVGKSQFSIELATKFNGEIINADSMQMYKGAPVITNKHPIEEREGIPHHVMNHVNWDEEYFIHRFEQEAISTINDIHSRGKLPIIVGGTHYYLNSLLFTNKTIKSTPKPTAQKPQVTPEQQAILDGPSEVVFETLKTLDPEVAEKFHPNDTRRVRRALEIFYLTNKKTSDHYLEQADAAGEESSLRFRTLPFWLFAQKPTLDKRLDERVDKMLEIGGKEEILELYDYYTSLPEKPDCERGVWQVIGFKEFLPWLESGKIDDKVLARSIEDMKTRTRQYAKKQVKWIKGLLATDLAKEEQHDYVNGGRLYLLDATDLDHWSETVSKRGQTITSEFLSHSIPSIPQYPESLSNLLPSPEPEEDKSSQWKHYTCDVCRNKDDSKLVLVGNKQYEIHLKSNRHRSNLNRGKRKRDYEEWLAKKNDESTSNEPTST
ncbi:CYFA0S04e00452g1_1 [Cyberlindnera fabianii]|uniref:tRNA dimethylallyltransferase n=1 Tax=Cyberlindnera fabianii TaxID=36022 RepID=A0A061AQR2_CYBFA|nr:CYFA0S04e00452g1_1 [Cyberlindnera fabianii]